MSDIPNTIEDLAKDLCEVDNTMSDAQSDDITGFESWKNSSQSRRMLFLLKAKRLVDEGEFILGKGYTNED